LGIGWYLTIILGNEMHRIIREKRRLKLSIDEESEIYL